MKTDHSISLSTSEVCAATGWSIDKVRDLIKSGKLPAVNTSSGSRPTYTISRAALFDFLVQPKSRVRKKPVKQVPEIF